MKIEAIRVLPCDYAAFRLKKIFEWFSQNARGIWIDRLVQSGAIDHCVTVDTYNSVILDGAEQYPLKLYVESLSLCEGKCADRFAASEAIRIDLRQSAMKSTKDDPGYLR